MAARSVQAQTTSATSSKRMAFMAYLSSVVTAASPGDGIVREVSNLSRDLLRAGVVRRRHIGDDCERVGGVGDLFGGRRPAGVAVRVAERHVRGSQEQQPRGFECDGIPRATGRLRLD